MTPPGCQYLEAVVYKMPKDYSHRGTWVVDPAVTVPKYTDTAVIWDGIPYTYDIANTTYVDPMNVSFNVTIGDAPPETDLLMLSCMNCMFRDQVAYEISINPPPATPGPPSCPMPAFANVSPITNPVPPPGTPAGVAPYTWIAGKTYDITINGKNFITKSAASETCPETQVGIFAPSGETLLQSSPNVISSTQITATVAPAASDPTETATVSLSAPYEQQGPTYKTQILNLKAVITDTSNIMDGIVTVKLTAPSGTSGDLTLIFSGTKHNYTQVYTGQTPGSHTLKLDLTQVPPDTYDSADGTWKANVPSVSEIQSVNVPSNGFARYWMYLGLTRFTQYNTPHESGCSGGTQPMNIFNRSSCTYVSGQLNSDFVYQTVLNGTGMSNAYGLLKPLGITNARRLCGKGLPPGASSENTFVQVSTVTGSCNTQIAADHSVATFPNPNGANGTLYLVCDDSLNLDESDNTTDYTRGVADKCPACAGGHHIDSYTDNTACEAHGAIGDLGNFYTSTTR